MASTTPLGSLDRWLDPTVQRMVRRGFPPMRKVFVDMCWPEELESLIPLHQLTDEPG